MVYLPLRASVVAGGSAYGWSWSRPGGDSSDKSGKSVPTAAADGACATACVKEGNSTTEIFTDKMYQAVAGPSICRLNIHKSPCCLVNLIHHFMDDWVESHHWFALARRRPGNRFVFGPGAAAAGGATLRTGLGLGRRTGLQTLCTLVGRRLGVNRQ
jgi:hypothetical protein